MTNEAFQKAWNEISKIAQNFDAPRRNLINWQMDIIAGMQDVSLMPDVVTLAINAVDTSVNTSSYNNLALDLADFIYGLVFLAKARYKAVVERSRQAAEDFLKTTAKILIENIGRLISDVSQGIVAALNVLRDLFFGNENWVKRLIDFFIQGSQAKAVEKRYIEFVDTVLDKMWRQKPLMSQSNLYSEIAHDNSSLLMEWKRNFLDKRYNLSAMEKVGAWILGIPALFLILASIVAIVIGAESPAINIAFLLIGVLLSIYPIFIIRSSQKRKQLKESKLEEYKEWLDEVKALRRQPN